MLAGAALGLGSIGAGCQESSTRLAGASRADSILSAIFETVTPTDAVLLASDPYNADSRQRGVLLLANAPWGGEGVYLDYYREALADEDAGVRIAAIRALALHGEPEDAPEIAGQLDPAQPDLVRWEAARALQRLHDDDAVPALLDAIDGSVEPDARVRAHAATALGQYADRRVVDRLIEALADPDLAVNVAAQKSLTTLTGEDFQLSIADWVSWSGDLNEAELFAGRREYFYPVFQRNPSFLEFINPFDSPPNEVAGSPVGLRMPTGSGAADGS